MGAAGIVDPAVSDGVSSKGTGPQKGSLQRLQAKNPSRCIGSPASSAGTFGGAKPGALDPTAMKNTRMVAVEKGAGGLFSADDMRAEVVALSASEHSLLLLGSAGLYRCCAPVDLAIAALAHTRDAAAASTACAQLAHAHQVHKSSDDA